MNIFITGGEGFIGSYVLRACLQKGHRITCLRRPTRRPIENTNDRDIKWVVSDLLDINAELIGDVDSIVHLAAAGISPRVASWSELERINVDGTLRLCHLAKEIGARLVIGGTFAEYGLSGERYEKIPTSAPLEPTYPYAISKATGSVYSLGYARSENIKLLYLRIFNAFGCGQDSLSLWPALRQAALAGSDFQLTKGDQIRDFVTVEHVAKYFLQAATMNLDSVPNPCVINVGSGYPQSVKDFCSFWWRHYNASGNLLVGALAYRPNEVMRFVPEIMDSFLG